MLMCCLGKATGTDERIVAPPAARWVLHAADGLSLFKEDLLPSAPTAALRFGPLPVVFPAFITFAVVPIGGVFCHCHDGIHRAYFGHRTLMQLADPRWRAPRAVVLSVAVYGVILSGFSSGSKYPLLGAGRRVQC